MSFFGARSFSMTIFAFAALVLVPACSGSEPADVSATGGVGSGVGGAGASGGSKSTGGSTGNSAPTWAELFANYFAAGTAGNCVGSGCHSAPIDPSFKDAATMCSSLKARGVIGNGAANFETLLTWFNQGGEMPMNDNPAPPNAVADITAWENAGAVCP